jgi:hypothetical protein
MLLPSLTLEEMRKRVREASALLRVAQQHARDAGEDLSKSEHASARIQSICKEVEELLPGMHGPQPPDAQLEAALAGLKELMLAQGVPVDEAEAEEGEPAEGELAEGEPDTDVDEGDEGDEDEGTLEDEETEEDEEYELEIDYAKLAAAIENEALMSRFPEPGRELFRQAARYLVEANERQVLFQGVIADFEKLTALTEQNVSETQKKLAMALTLEELKGKRKG